MLKNLTKGEKNISRVQTSRHFAYYFLIYGDKIGLELKNCQQIVTKNTNIFNSFFNYNLSKYV